MRVLGVPVKFTTTVEEFIAHDSMKLSYTKQPLSNEIFVKSHELLFEQGLSDIDIHVHDWENTKAFFPTSERSNLPYDIFAATFYLLSRYEEYLPHVKDEYGRFMASESIAHKNNFLHQPVVDIWSYKLKKVLEHHFPDFDFPKKKYSVKPIIDVPSPYLYKLKGIMRTVGGTVKDIFSFRLRNIYERFSVLLGFKHDPYDTFKYIINRQKQSKYKFLFFFLIGDYSTFDKGINIQKRKYVALIKHVLDYCNVGLKVSYFALNNKDILKKEKKTIEQVINTSLLASRNSFSKLNLPESYENMVELEIFEDYTMGYVNEIGFRAGTCTPFFFYDLDYEIQTPLKISSYHILDYALLKTVSLLDKKKVVNQLINEIKQVHGEFVFVFHNYTFSNSERWKHFKELFNHILDSQDEA